MAGGAIGRVQRCAASYNSHGVNAYIRRSNLLCQHSAKYWGVRRATDKNKGVKITPTYVVAFQQILTNIDGLLKYGTDGLAHH